MFGIWVLGLGLWLAVAYTAVEDFFGGGYLKCGCWNLDLG